MPDNSPINNDPIINTGGTLPDIARSIENPFLSSQERLKLFVEDPNDPVKSLTNYLNSLPGKGGGVNLIPNKEIDRTGRYNYFIPGADNEELYAQRQSRWDKMANGLLKMGGTFLSTVAENTVGMVYGIGKAIGSGKMSDVYDNDLNQWIDAQNKKLKNILPNYYTHAEKDAEWYSPAHWFTGNFLWDGIINNLGFSAGAYFGIGMWSKILKGISLAAPALSAGKGAELLASLEATLPNIPKAERINTFLSSATDATKGFAGNVLLRGNRVTSAFLATTGEAQIEALNNINEFRSNAIGEYQRQWGIPPTGEALDKINEQAENVGNWSFWLNTALLTGTNYIQAPRVLGNSYKDAKAIANGIETQPIIRDVEKEIYKSGLPQSGIMKKLTQLKNIGGLFFNPIEGFEEGAQYSIQRGTENYFNRKLQGKDANWLEDALGYGVRQTLSTTEGMDNIVMGALSGGLMTSGILPVNRLMGGQSLIKERGFTGYGGEREKATQEAINAFSNSSFVDRLKTNAKHAEGAQVSAHRMAVNARQGDIMEFKEDEFDYMMDYLLPRIKYGRYDFVKEDLNQTKFLATTPEGLQQLKEEGRAAQNDTQPTFLQRLANIENHADNVKKLYDALNLRYGGVTTTDAEGKKERKYPDLVIDKMVYASSKVKDYDGRIRQLSSSLLENGVNVQEVLDKISVDNAKPEAAIKEALNQINTNDNLTDDVKDELKQELQDISEISIRRKQFLKEYNSIIKSPEKWSKESPITIEEDKTPLVTKEGATPIELEKRYSLEQRVIKQGNKIIVAPSIELLSKTLGEEVQVRKPDGTIGFVTPEELGKYNLSETPERFQERITKKADEIVTKFAEDKDISLPKDADLNAKLDVINSKDDKELSNELFKALNEGFEQINKEIQKELEFLKNKELHDKLHAANKTVEAGAGTIGTLPPGDGLEPEWDGTFPAKDLSNIPSAETSGDYEDKPHHKTRNNFLSRAADSRVVKSGELRAIVITKNNEDAYGLSGITAYLMKGAEEKYDINDPQKSPIIKLYVGLHKNGQFYLIDQNGEELKGEVDFAKIPMGTFHTPDGAWKWSGKYSEEDVAAVKDNMKKWRENVFKFTNSTIFYEIRGVSRGISQKNKGDKNSVVGTLTTQTELGKPGLVTVPTKEGEITVNDRTIPFTPGRPLFVNGSTVENLDNRNLTENEANLVFSLLKEKAKSETKGTPNTTINSFLNGLLYMREPEEGKPVGRNQIWVSKDGYLMIGKDIVKVAFTAESLEANKDQITKALKDTYNNINNLKLTKDINKPFLEIVGMNENGLQTVTWKSYQHYLLSPVYDLIESDKSELRNKSREPLLTTSIRKIVDENDSNFRSKYSTLQGSEFEIPKSVVKKEEAPKGEKIGKFILDGKTLNTTFTSKNEKIVFTAAKEGDGFIVKVITDVKEKGDFDTIKERLIKDGQTPEQAEETIKNTAFQAIVKELKQPEAAKVEEPKPQAISSVEAKKADIERRRQEELKTLNQEKLEFEKLTFSQANPIYHEGMINSGELGKETRINIKYDAELAALEGKKEAAPKVEEKKPEATAVKEEKLLDLSDLEGTLKGDKEHNISVSAVQTKYKVGYDKALRIRDVYEKSKELKKIEETPTKTEEDQKKLIEKRKKKAKDRGFKDEKGDPQFRIATEMEGYKEGNVKAELEYVQSKLPFSTEILDYLIKTPEGAYAWGDYKNLAIRVYEEAQEGTGFHEAFEGVWDVFSSPRERNRMLTEFKRRKGTFFDRNSESTIPYSGATERQAIDKMADEFGEYILYNTPPPKSIDNTNFIVRFFRNIWQFIQSIFTGDVATIEDKFRAIDAGKYKSAPFKSVPEGKQRLSIAIGKLNYTQRYEVTRGIALEVVQKFIEGDETTASRNLVEFDENPNASTEELYQKVYDSLKGWYEDRMYNRIKNDGLLEAYNNTWLEIKNNWEDAKKATNEVLKTLSIVKKSETADNETVNEEANDDKSMVNYQEDKFTVDAKQRASTSIKLLIYTLAKGEFAIGSENNEVKLGSDPNQKNVVSIRTPLTQMQQQVEFNKLFNQLLGELSSLNTYDEKIAKLNELRTQFPDYQRLYNRLVNTAGEALDQWKLKTRFYNVFAKQRPVAFTSFIDEKDGSSYTAPGSLSDSTRIMVQSWLDRMKATALSGDSPYITVNDKGEFNVKGNELKVADISAIEGKLQFLFRLGIEEFEKKHYNVLSNKEKKEFNNAVSGLYSSLTGKKLIPLENSKSLDNIQNLNKIAQAFILGGNEFDATFFNIDGERTQTFVENNAVSKDTNSINNAQTREDLLKSMPQLDGFDAKSSLFLNRILFSPDGKRTDKQLEIRYVEGLIDNQNDSTYPMSRLSRGRRLSLEINQNLNGNYYILIPAESKREWMQWMGNVYEFESLRDNNLVREEIYRVFENYLDTELALYERDGKHRLLSELSDKYTATKEKFRENLREFIRQTSDDTLNFLIEKEVVKKLKSEGEYSFLSLDRDFAKKYKLDAKRLSDKNIRAIMQFRTVNYMVNNIEMQKLFFGDVGEYIKDGAEYDNRFVEHFKRIKSFLSPRESSIYGNEELNQFLNTLNKSGNVALKPGDPGYTQNSDYIKTGVFEDIISTNTELGKSSPKYGETNATDSQAWSTLVGHRKMLFKSGRWTSPMDYVFQYRMAVDRRLMDKDGVYKYSSEALRKADDKIIEDYKFNNTFIPALKPIVSGHTLIDGEWFPLIDKDSIAPLSYTMVRGTNMQSVYIQMLNEDIDYIIGRSGRKTGAKNAESLYSEEGGVNKELFKNTTNVPFSAFGIQQETLGKSDSQTRGSQATKLSYLNLLDAGVPTDYEGGDKWYDLTEKEKLDNSKIYAEIKHGIDLLREQAEIGYQTLLRQIGAKDTGDGFVIPDKNRLLVFVKNELLRREVADVIKDALHIDPATGDLAYAFETLSNYTQIKNILYSYVDKYISRPKLSGGPKVQVSGALMESLGIKRTVTKSGKTIYTSAGLKFYEPKRNDKGEITSVGKMEVLLPFWAAKKLRQAGIEWTDAKELMAIIRKSPDAESILSGIGFRIPTQEMNSMDAFEITGFLPEEMGDMVVLPEEITTKTGSDFDVDKLNTYLRNVYVDGNNVVKVVKRKELTPEEWYEINLRRKYEQFRKFSAEKKMEIGLSVNFGLYEEGDIEAAEEAIEDKRIPSIEEFKVQTAHLSQQDFNRAYNRRYKEAIENEYFDHLERIILHPRNYERLVQPNSSDDLIDIRNRLVKIAPKEFGQEGIKSILNPLFISEFRHQLLETKGGVGIASNAQTNNALAQLTEISILPENIANLKNSNERDYIEDGYINLPHNKDRNGRATVSRRLDQAGKIISDKISQFLNGFVDAIKDPFLVQMGVNRVNTPTWLMLHRFGVPNDKETPLLSMFMNQPIIREYMNYLDNKGMSGNAIYIGKNITAVKSLFTGNKDGNKKFKQFLSDTTGKMKPASQEAAIWKENDPKKLANHLEATIEKYYSGKALTRQEADEQHFILDEFMKYYVISQNLFRVTRGTNFDTAKFSTRDSILFKNLLYEDAIENNIFTGIQSVLSSSFIGTERRVLNSSKDMYDSISGIRDALPILDDIKASFVNNWAVNDTIGRRVDEQYIAYLLQTKLGTNRTIESLLLDNKTALVTELKGLKKSVEGTDLAENPILKFLFPYLKGNKRSITKNLNLVIKPRDVHGKNLYNSAFEELLNHPTTEGFARRLARTALLQSGISNSPISMKDYLPLSIYSEAIKEALKYQGEETARNFRDVDGFYRNSWGDTDVVPVVADVADNEDPVTRQWTYKRLGVNDNGIVSSFKKTNNIQTPVPFATFDSRKKEASSKFITMPIYDHITFDLLGKYLMKRVEDNEGNPVKLPYIYGNRYLYVAVNAWGDSFRGQEFYDTPQPTVYQNGYVRIENEIDTRQLASFINSGEFKNKPAESSPVLPNEFTVIPDPIVDTIAQIFSLKKGEKEMVYAPERTVEELAKYTKNLHSVSVAGDNEKGVAIFQTKEKQDEYLSYMKDNGLRAANAKFLGYKYQIKGGEALTSIVARRGNTVVHDELIPPEMGAERKAEIEKRYPDSVVSFENPLSVLQARIKRYAPGEYSRFGVAAEELLKKSTPSTKESEITPEDGTENKC